VTNDQHATTIYPECLSRARSVFGAVGIHNMRRHLFRARAYITFPSIKLSRVHKRVINAKMRQIRW